MADTPYEPKNVSQSAKGQTFYLFIYLFCLFYLVLLTYNQQSLLILIIVVADT